MRREVIPKVKQDELKIIIKFAKQIQYSNLNPGIYSLSFAVAYQTNCESKNKKVKPFSDCSVCWCTGCTCLQEDTGYL